MSKTTVVNYNAHLHLTSRELCILSWIDANTLQSETDGHWYIDDPDNCPFTGEEIASLAAKVRICETMERPPGLIQSDGTGGVYVSLGEVDVMRPPCRRLQTPRRPLRRRDGMAEADRASPRRQSSRPVQSDRPASRRRRRPPVC